MHFAHRLGGVTRLAKNRGEGRRAGPERAMVVPSLVFVNGQTAQQRVARRGAHRESAKAVVETHAIGGERIDVGRFDFLVAVGAQAVDAVFIRVDDQDMEAEALPAGTTALPATIAAQPSDTTSSFMMYLSQQLRR
jgi:hypothetical protein